MYKIGVFAKMNKVTVKTLRYYDEIGLLSPCYVDQTSGHRYYSAEQVNHLHRILALKDIGFSLHEIMAATRRGISKDELIAYLQGKQSELSISIAMEQRKLSQLDSYIDILLREDDLMTKKVNVKEVISSIYQIEIPLSSNPLKVLNSYLIKGPERSLLIDTGFNSRICKDALLAGLGKLAVDLNNLDFFIANMYGDHSGLVYDLVNKDAKVYCSEIDAKFVNDAISLMEHDSVAGLNLTLVSDGDVLSIGDYSFTCMINACHICLYEPEEKIIIAGDHILFNVSPSKTVV